MTKYKYGMQKSVQNDLQQCINSFERMKRGGIGIADELVCDTCKRALKYIDELEEKLADVAPVRHGHWKKSKGYERPTENGFVHDDRYVCDCCGWGCCCETKLDFNFCPNCGASMTNSR